MYVYALSPRMRRASWISLGIIVTLFAWMAHRLVSSKRPTRYASAASCSAATADDWNLKSVLKSWAISLTSLWRAAFLSAALCSSGIFGFHGGKQFRAWTCGASSLHQWQVQIFWLPWSSAASVGPYPLLIYGQFALFGPSLLQTCSNLHCKLNKPWAMMNGFGRYHWPF